ncbi:MAG: hypothetical protein COB71_02800 [Thiotrichales bacterium]|nr:MAG: hypothetical protein COB71_02800 [Thiotrichales bacterium]
MVAQLAYLRVLRVKMDYATGIAGGVRGKNMIRYSTIAERVGYVPGKGSNRPAWRPTKDEMRCALDELKRAGLIEDAGSSMRAGIVKKLVFALRDQSVQNMNPTGTPQKSPTVNPTASASNRAGLDDVSTTGNDIEKSGGTPQHPVSVKITTTTHAREPRFFAMHEQWEPDGESLKAHARMQGVLVDSMPPDVYADVLGEFKSFWVGQVREETHSGWEGKLVKSIKHELAKPRGVRDGRSNKQGGAGGGGCKSGAENLFSVLAETGK